MNFWKASYGLFCLFFLTVCAISLPVYAQEAEGQEEMEESAEDLLKEIAEMGPGVHEIQKDDDGRIVSFIVVGQGTISTALGKAKGVEAARRKAELDCSAQMIKWLKEDVSLFEGSDEETVLVMEGEESEMSSSLKESAKSIEKTTKKMESTSAGIVRGLQLLHTQQDGDGKTFTVVKGWDLETSEGTKGIAESSKSDKAAGGSGSAAGGGKQGNPDKQIESKSRTSRSAGEFLKRRKK